MSDKDLEEPKFFVSRRGRQVSINQLDLGGIDVESEPALPETVKAAPKKQSTKPAIARSRSSWSKRKKVTIALIVGVILLFPLVIGELVAAQYREAVPDAKAELDKVVNTSVLPMQKRSDISADQIRNVTNDIDKIAGKMCKGGLLDNMATLYPRAATAHASCKKAQSSHAALVNTMRVLEKETRYLEKVDAALKSAAVPVTEGYAVVGAQQETWADAAKSLDTITPSLEMKAAHQELTVHVKAIAEGWSKLAQANSDQNAAAFMEAEKMLATEYEAVRGASAGFNEVLLSVQSQVSLAYDELR